MNKVLIIIDFQNDPLKMEKRSFMKQKKLVKMPNRFSKKFGRTVYQLFIFDNYKQDYATFLFPQTKGAKVHKMQVLY